MVALEGSWQEFLTKTKAEPPDAHALPLSKNCPAVRFCAVSRASCGPVGEQSLLQDGNIITDRRPAPLDILLYNEAAFANLDAVGSRPCFLLHLMQGGMMASTLFRSRTAKWQ